MRHSRNPASRHSAANYARENHESLISRTTFPRRMIGCPARIGVLLITITFRVCGVAVTADDDAVRNTEPGGILRIEIVMPGLILIDGSETRMLDVADSVRSRVDRDHVTDVWITAEKDVPYRFVTDVGGAASLDGEVALRIRVRGNNAPRRHAKKQRYVRRREHDPNGIGKFYMGREIARVMGFGFNGDGARWLERTEREEEERLTLLVRSLELRPGMVVADVGAGSGVISMLMAERILPAGYVIAVDVQDEMLLRLKKNIRVKGLRNIIPIKGSQTSPSLAPASVDLIIMVDVYHEFEYPYEMMVELSRALKPGGRIAFVEYRTEDPAVPIKLVHKMSEAQVKKEAGRPEFGLTWQETVGVLPRQHIVIFRRTAEDADDDDSAAAP